MVRQILFRCDCCAFREQRVYNRRSGHPNEEVLVPAENSPIKALEQRLSDIVSIKLKDDRIFRGRLTRCDQYMNLTLGDAVELENDETKAKYGSILIRGNNILWIQIPE